MLRAKLQDIASIPLAHYSFNKYLFHNCGYRYYARFWKYSAAKDIPWEVGT